MSTDSLSPQVPQSTESKLNKYPVDSKEGVSKESLRRNSVYSVGENRTSVQSAIRQWILKESKVNYISEACMASDFRPSIIQGSVMHGLKNSFLSLPKDSGSGEDLKNKSKDEELLIEKFPLHVTNLMNEGNYWGCFYNFPELYADVFSPVVRILNLEDVPELVGGELTKDMVTACLTYLKRTPILGDLVYIKLDLSSKRLQNIDVLMNYKFLVYLDLSTNLLTELTVLSSLPYLQYLSVAFNRLNTVLEYETPQWFLTEVHYKYNSVKKIRNLTEFWSITILDLSHNNIKSITGLENLKFLRRLDLSFNHIQRLENLNHLRLLWLDVSYNNISSCEFSASTGLWTLLHLEYLNLNENNLTSMKMFSYCTRLRELHLRNNRLSVMLELPVYMRQLRRLIVLDLRANPICSVPAYKTVIINTFRTLLILDAADLNPVEQRTLMMDTTPDITVHTTRKLLRLIYIEQLSKARVSPYVPPADTTDVPIVVLVGHEGVGKGTLSRRLATECSSNIQQARQHTTATSHYLDHYKEITRNKFDDMLLAGDFLTYSEMDGESYGLSREEAFVTDGKVKVVCLDLPAALMLKLRGYRPYLILTTRLDIESLKKIQELRKTYRTINNRGRLSLEVPVERSTLQVMLSGRIIITGIINEMIMTLPDKKEKNEFTIESECSLLLDSATRKAKAEEMDDAKRFNVLALLQSSSVSLDEVRRQSHDMEERSLYSLFKGSQGTAEYASDLGQHQSSYQERNSKRDKSRSKYTDKHSIVSQSHRFAPVQVSSKSTNSKSVTFTYHGEGDQVTGLMVDIENETEAEQPLQSISTKMPWPLAGWQARLGSNFSMDESDLWLAFLTEAGFLQNSESNITQLNVKDPNRFSKNEDVFIPHINNWESSSPTATGLTDPYENIHRQCPGLFWDTVAMDDPEAAFINVRKIIRNIVKSQKKLRPMFEINFAQLSDYPTVERKLTKIRKEIAPQQLFY